MTREEIEQKAVERFPIIPFGNESTGIIDCNENLRLAYTEGALMVVEAYSDVCQQCEGKKYIEVTDLSGSHSYRQCPFCI